MTTAVPSWPPLILIMIIGIAVTTMSCGDSPSDPTDETFAPLSPGMWWVYETKIVTDLSPDTVQYRDSVVVVTSQNMNGRIVWRCDVYRNGTLSDTTYWAHQGSEFYVDYAFLCGRTDDNTVPEFFTAHRLGHTGSPMQTVWKSDPDSIPYLDSVGVVHVEVVTVRTTVKSTTMIDTGRTSRIELSVETGVLVGPETLPVKVREGLPDDVLEQRPADSSVLYRTQSGTGEISYSWDRGPLQWRFDEANITWEKLVPNHVSRTCIASSTGYRIQGMGRKGAAVQ